MNTFVLESEDLDFLMTEECQMFMYEAAPKVKESFFKRAIAKIKEMLQKISDFITSATTKKQAEKIKKAADTNPRLGSKKVKIEDYQETYKLGKSALKKLEKAKTKEEADKIVAQYKRNRVIKTVTISVAALATLVAGGKLFQRARGQMTELRDEVKKAEKSYGELTDYLKSTKAEYNKANAALRKGAKNLTPNESEFGNGVFASNTRANIKAKQSEKLSELYGKKHQAKEEIQLLQRRYAIGILSSMAKDVQSQVTRPFHALKGVAAGRKTSRVPFKNVDDIMTTK